jgi:hypothetical protein
MMRSSLYLASRCETLFQALSFFNKAHPSFTKEELGLIFMAQLDFWSFELDNLIYLFQTFEDRQQDWTSIDSIDEKIRKQGLIIKKSHLGKLKYHRYGRKTNPIEDPKDLLNKVLDLWNELIDHLKCMEDSQALEKSDACGASLKSLESFKKDKKTNTVEILQVL